MLLIAQFRHRRSTMWMLVQGIATLVPVIFSIFMYYGISLTDQDKGAIKDFFQNLMLRYEKELPQPINITEIREKDFNFNDQALIKVLNTTKFAQLKEAKACELYKDQAKEDLHQVIDAIGVEANLTQNQIKLMKLSLNGNGAVKATEVFEHGRKGLYLLMKYTSTRTASGNFDLMIAMYGCN